MIKKDYTGKAIVPDYRLMTCKNCGREAAGNYCSHCGQSTRVGRLNGRNFINEVTESVFQVNRGILFTVKALSVRPGKSIREFLQGKRKKHFKPVAYTLVFSTVYFLLSRATGENTWLFELISGFMDGLNDNGKTVETPAAVYWVSRNYAYAMLLLIPVFSLASLIVFPRGVNYIEHIVLNAYVTGHQALIYSVFLLSYSFVDHYEWLTFIFSITYAFWVYGQFFGGNRVIIILRTALVYFLYLFMVTLFLGIVFFGI